MLWWIQKYFRVGFVGFADSNIIVLSDVFVLAVVCRLDCVAVVRDVLLEGVSNILFITIKCCVT